jgi:hypothetical protein
MKPATAQHPPTCLCEGTGRIEATCWLCRGSGEGAADGTTCPVCGGGGVEARECEEEQEEAEA